MRLPGLSLRARLLAIALVLSAVGLVVSNVLVIGALRGQLVTRVDQQVGPLATAMSRLPPSLLSSLPDTVSHGLAGRSDLLGDLYVAHLTRDGGADAMLRSPASAA
ncbi:hypothetical protein, partial [Actinoallomurus acaciae]